MSKNGKKLKILGVKFTKTEYKAAKQLELWYFSLVMKRLLPAFLMMAIVEEVSAQGGHRVWQPVLDYAVREPASVKGAATGGMHRMNPFITYTHLGTDFGFHGPGEGTITWCDGRVSLAPQGEDWAGMWHSLAGQAMDSTQVLDFDHCYPPMVSAALQPSISELMVKAAGHGTLKVEIKSARQETLWMKVFEVDSAEQQPLTALVPAHELGAAKFVNWTVEPGSDMSLTALDLGLRMPDDLPFDRYVLLTSYAKMARCYSPDLGFVRDRAHIRGGDFNSIPATGLFALATAMMSQSDVGMVPVEAARDVVRKIWQSVAAVPTGKGLLPHFVTFINGHPMIHPGTEFSTVDTAIYYQSMFMAAQMLDDHDTSKAVLDRIKAVDFPSLLLTDGAISHGLRDDGQTLIKFGWRDWGGETALVMLLARMAGTMPNAAIMQTNGEPWQGTGFIAEIQSLLYPDFDQPIPDAVSRVNWHEARENLLSRQKNYFPAALNNSAAAKLGYYGLSAGEGAYGTTYEVGGVDLPAQQIVHPHYILMSGALEEHTEKVYALLHRMEQEGWLTPWGLVENIRADGTSYLPMISALNAGFETLGAYHLLAKAHHQEDCIYKAARESTELRDAVKFFYPGPIAKQ